MQITQEQNGAYLVLSLKEPRLDAAIAVPFRERMAAIIDAGSKRVVLDLAAVQFIDSSGLGALVSVLKQIGNDGDLRLCGLREGVYSLLRLTRMNRVLKTFDSLELALVA